MSEEKPIVGNYRLIPKGTSIFSIALQEMITFPENDMIVEIKHRVNDDNDYFFGQIKILLFAHMIPGYIDKTHGEICTYINKTLPYNKIETFNV